MKTSSRPKFTASAAVIAACAAAVAAAAFAADAGATPANGSRPSVVPIVRQALRNNCETAALSMLLAADNVRIPQLQLQRELRRSGPLDPIGSGSARVWGDPNRGYVGRAEGGGAAGGFGVYQWPIAALAAKHGVPLRNLSGGSPARIYRSLQAGRPVLVWIALSSGPYGSWRTGDGKRITVNFGEHTVVLTGVHGSYVHVNDPLDGTRKLWSKSAFESMWRGLNRRALGL